MKKDKDPSVLRVVATFYNSQIVIKITNDLKIKIKQQSRMKPLYFLPSLSYEQGLHLRCFESQFFPTTFDDPCVNPTGGYRSLSTFVSDLEGGQSRVVQPLFKLLSSNSK